MSVALSIPLIQLLQVLTIAVGAPGVTGVIAKVEAGLQGRRGPRIAQPYYDLAKLFRKEALAPEGASWFFLAAPVIAVAAYLTVPLLIPVLTSYPLPLGYMGDILGGGFLLSLASFVVATAALETGDPYAQLGSSRAKTFSAITEPVVLFVVFTVALLTGTDQLYGYIGIDAVSAIFLLATGFLYAAIALYSVGYLKQHEDLYARRFYAGLNLFAWAMLAAPMMSSLALLWIAVEVTTIISALLVAIEDTDGAAEAAWKYVLIASAGPQPGAARDRVRLLRRVAGARRALQPGHPAADRRRRPAPAHPGPARVPAGAAGLRHQGRPVPGAHLAAGCALRGTDAGVRAAVRVAARGELLRDAAVLPGHRGHLGTGFPRGALLAFGVASLLLAALYVFGQRDIKRLLAYSSVEHMGILAIGVSFGAPVALAGVLLHVLAHAAAKGNAFMGAGVLRAKFGSKQISAIRGGLDLLPWSGPLFLLAVFALSALPPSGIFRSEFQIVAGGLARATTPPPRS